MTGKTARRLMVGLLMSGMLGAGPVRAQETITPLLSSDLADISGKDSHVVSRNASLERLTTMSPPLEGVVLRYGQLDGPGTGRDEPTGPAPLHVDAAARAALLAIGRGNPGMFNIAEDDGYVSIAKALRELGFDPGFRLARDQRTKIPSGMSAVTT